MNCSEYLHNMFVRAEQIAPARIKGFKRHDLLKLFAQFGFKTGIEVGVAEGKFSEAMCLTIPGLKLSSVDPWKVGDDHRSRQIGQKLADQRYEEAKARLNPHNVQIVKNTSMEAVRAFADGMHDFVYIDGCHEFDYVMQDIIEWSKKVRPGGIVAGHDYYHFKHAGVMQAVEVYTMMHSIHEWFVTDERTPSFFWVKP